MQMKVEDSVKLIKEEKLIKFMNDNDTTLTEVLDAVVKTNNVIGVGIVRLSDSIETYLSDKYITKN